MVDDDVLEIAIRNAPGIFASITTIVAGIYILMHDAQDFGKFEHEELEKKSILDWIRDPFHHWQWGFIILAIGLVSLVLQIIKILLELKIITIDKSVIKQIGKVLDKWFMRNALIQRLLNSLEQEGRP